MRTEDLPSDAFLIIPEVTAWGCSGLALDDFGELVRAMVDAGYVIRARRDLVFANLEAAQLVLGRRPARRSRRRRSRRRRS